MSWKATAWAKETRGHKSYGQKLVLMMLADYHSTEHDGAWPSQQVLSQDCEMSERTVRNELAKLEAGGFITMLHKGNQYQPTVYRLNFDVTSPIYEPAKSEPAIIAAANEAPIYEPAISDSEPAMGDKVNRQFDASEPAISHPPLAPPFPHTPIPPLTPPETAIEPSILIKEGQQIFRENSTNEVWPDWYGTMWAIPGFKVPLAHAEAWLAKKGISVERAETTAYAVKSKWPGNPKRPYTDPWATFQSWVKRPPLPVPRANYGRPQIGRTMDDYPETFNDPIR